MKLAVFDFDGTLLRGNSWHRFFRWQLRTQPLTSPGLLAAFAWRRMRLLSSRALQERALGAWRGRTRAEVTRTGEQLYHLLIEPHLRPAGLQEIERCRAEDFEVVVLSGAFDFLVQPFAETCEIARWRATRLEYDAEVFTGRLLEASLTGEAKAAALASLGAGETVDWAASRAYGNESGDLPVLRLVGLPCWVRTRRKPPAGLPAPCRLVDW